MFYRTRSVLRSTVGVIFHIGFYYRALLIWYDLIWYDMTWHYITRHGMIWHDMTFHYWGKSARVFNQEPCRGNIQWTGDSVPSILNICPWLSLGCFNLRPLLPRGMFPLTPLTDLDAVEKEKISSHIGTRTPVFFPLTRSLITALIHKSCFCLILKSCANLNKTKLN